MDQKFQGQDREIALKRKLIQDPDQSFWEGPRPKLGVTLGEAVVFSPSVYFSMLRGNWSHGFKEIPGSSGFPIQIGSPKKMYVLSVVFVMPQWLR
jgi:hypothetical protein